VVFTIVVAASGWIGYWLDKSLNAGTCVQLGLLIWLIVPLLTVLLLREVLKHLHLQTPAPQTE